MAQHYGSYFYIKHPDKTEIDRLRDAIMNQTEIAEIWDIQFKGICILYVQIQEYDESVPNRIVLKFELRRYLPCALIETLEQSGFQIVAKIYDFSGGDAWVYANDEFVPIPNWIDLLRLPNYSEERPYTLEDRLQERRETIEARRKHFYFDLTPTADIERTWPNFPRVPLDHGLPSEEQIREWWSRKDEPDPNLEIMKALAAGTIDTLASASSA